MKTTPTLTLIRVLSREVQISVIATDIILTLYVLWLIVTNTSHWLTGVLFGYTPFGVWLLLRANHLFGLCYMHRCMLLHSFLVYCCCVYQARVGFGLSLPYFRWFMFLTGLILIFWLIIRRRHAICC